MPKRPWPDQRSPSLVRGFAAAFALLVVAGACESTPCVGDACPNLCNGASCDADADTGTPAPTTRGRFTPCGSNASCDEASGFSCVDGSCQHPCRSHFDCGGVARCERSGRGGAYCALTTPPTEPGGYYSTCPTGECDTARGFSCVGAGVGDTESYCTSDCVSDADCPAGFLCDALSSASGTARTMCVPRGFCAECTSDEDCLSVPGGVCARDASGEKHCTAECDPNRNSCPWGASTDCRVTDDELGAPTCQHRSGSCGGEGNGCDPCVRDDECPNGYCLTSFYTGERWCVDQTLPCSCEGLPNTQDFCGGANGCPDSPSGLRMVCYDTSPPGEGFCVGVNLPGSSTSAGQLSCWR
ncbi:MAG TPA: hypothetical protein VMS65_00575 [Polyangiaceae bacterium]|nr:hypothetical protein [Polyangiaceae bacterium]